MEHLELIIFGLLVAIAGLAVIARVVDVPYPILLVVGGLAKSREATAISLINFP